MPAAVYRLFSQECPALALADVSGKPMLVAENASSDRQRWTTDAVFAPDDGIVGFVIINQGSQVVLKFNGAKQLLQLGGRPSPPSAEIVWSPSPTYVGETVYWNLRSCADLGQAVDVRNEDACRDPTRVEAWDAKNNSNQHWRFVKVA